jgi:hypothetical protein
MSLSNRQSCALVTSALLAVREWEKKNLPSSESILAFEIFILIAHHTVSEKPLTLHQLFYSVDFSETGVRKQLAKLIDGGWCCIVGGSQDKRLKHVVAEAKMLEVLDSYTLQICDLLVDKVTTHKEILTSDS